MSSFPDHHEFVPSVREILQLDIHENESVEESHLEENESESELVSIINYSHVN